ncbi:hypothetical protein [Gimesia sp.]|uniref:hypothetical protein n=1 Tax=Gimesia sp. TaxID=2024833 RepID=UPI000C43BA0C|nr:hypothetical protein [Gimesia sp.]MAX38572.1 hypothetical protein [Gimesia sp.]HAH46206.1 hypothetical protein [Planctomycetaceae bacterium]HBL44478.1 hypothetical protein [Planctomycetaceae bacterium]|tara:strand:+ start:6395 stop:6721 length:327 start_codon:yes stop_codon:yes gene_type:complete
MVDPIRIIGVHPISASESCHLVEIELNAPADEFDFGSVTQEMPDQSTDNWQVAYEEQQVGDVEVGSRWAFFFHNLVFERPLLTPLGSIAIPDPTRLPSHLKEIEYYEP